VGEKFKILIMQHTSFDCEIHIYL